MYFQSFPTRHEAPVQYLADPRQVVGSSAALNNVLVISLPGLSTLSDRVINRWPALDMDSTQGLRMPIPAMSATSQSSARVIALIRAPHGAAIADSF